MREEPRGKASAQESPEKKREKLTDKLTFLGVFQTYRPSASKLTICTQLRNDSRSLTVFLAGDLLLATTYFFILMNILVFGLQTPLGKPPTKSCRNRSVLTPG
uniref:Uncharacterized protein n=1 Tax=Heterorhabditis bacteriophora TaxID=37862 RepID=A0A1I7XPB4_HETBA